MKTTYSMDDIKTGEPGQYAVHGERDKWWVVGTDRNGVWVVADPGREYRTKREATEAAQEFRSAWEPVCN